MERKKQEKKEGNPRLARSVRWPCRTWHHFAVSHQLVDFLGGNYDVLFRGHRQAEGFDDGHGGRFPLQPHDALLDFPGVDLPVRVGDALRHFRVELFGVCRRARSDAIMRVEKMSIPAVVIRKRMIDEVGMRIFYNSKGLKPKAQAY